MNEALIILVLVANIGLALYVYFELRAKKQVTNLSPKEELSEEKIENDLEWQDDAEDSQYGDME